MFSKACCFLQIGYVSLNCSILIAYQCLCRTQIAINTEKFIDVVTYMNLLVFSALVLIYTNTYEQQNDAPNKGSQSNITGDIIVFDDVCGGKTDSNYVENFKSQHKLPIKENCQYSIEDLEDFSENESSAETLFEDSLEEISDKNFGYLMGTNIEEEELEIKLNKKNTSFTENTNKSQSSFKIIEGDSGALNEIQYWKKKCFKLKNDNQSYSLRARTLKNKLSSQSMEIKSLKRTISSSMQLLNSHIKENNDIYNRFQDLQQNFELLENKCEFDKFLKNEKLQIFEKTTQIEQLLKDNRILSKELDFKNKVFTNLFEESSRLQSQADNSKEQIRILNSKVDLASKEKNRLTLSIKDLTSKKFRSEETNLKIFKENTLLRIEFDNLKNLNSRLADENVSSSKKLRDSQNRLNSLKQINIELRESNKELLNQFEEAFEIREVHEAFIKDTMGPMISGYQNKLETLTTLLQKIMPQLMSCKSLLNKDFQLSQIDELRFNLTRNKKILQTCIKENSRLKNELEISQIEAQSYKQQLVLSEEMLNIFKADEKDLKFSKASGNLDNFNSLNKEEIQEEQSESKKNNQPTYSKISTTSELYFINSIQSNSANKSSSSGSSINPFIISTGNSPHEFDNYKQHESCSSFLDEMPNFKDFELEISKLVEEVNTFVYSNTDDSCDFETGLRSMICDLADNVVIFQNYATMIANRKVSAKFQADYKNIKNDLSVTEKKNQSNNSKSNRSRISIYKDSKAADYFSVGEGVSKTSKTFNKMSVSLHKENENFFGVKRGEITPINRKISNLLQRESSQTYITPNKLCLSVKPSNSMNV